MNLISKLLISWEGIFQYIDPSTQKPWDTSKPLPSGVTDYSWMGSIFSTISIVLYIIMGLVGAAGAIYAIYLGVQLARAEEQGKRDDAKKHLITVLIAVGVTIALVLFFNLLLPEIVYAFMGHKNIYGQLADGTKPTAFINSLNIFLN